MLFTAIALDIKELATIQFKSCACYTIQKRSCDTWNTTCARYSMSIRKLVTLNSMKKNLAFSRVQTLIVHMYFQFIVYKVDIGS